MKPIRVLSDVMTPDGRGILIGRTPEGLLVVVRGRPPGERDKLHGPTFPPEFWSPEQVLSLIALPG